MQISLLLMKNIFDAQNLLEILSDIYAKPIDLSDKEQLKKFYENISSYIYNLSDKNLLAKIMELMEKLRTQQSKGFISIAEHLEMKGKLEGRIEGIETGIKKVAFSLLQQGVSDEIILIATNLTQYQLNYLKTLPDYTIKLEPNL